MAIEDRGFASMDPKRQAEIASKGGKAAHEKGTAYKFTSEAARKAAAASAAARRLRKEAREASRERQPGEAAEHVQEGEHVGAE